ncbi:MAG: hypothetical protein KA785_00525 [Spirochaetaceae bacterium]|nr:hypothetical protein [Spirochaetaceae bacterium]
MMKRFYRGVILLLLFTSCAGTKTFNGRADLHGAVYDVKSRPVPNCVILLDGKEKALTDINGRFVLYGLQSAAYTIEACSSYCERYNGEIQFLNETQYILITVVDNETLYDLVEDALEKKDYDLADKTIKRLFAVNKNNPNAIMYLAVIRYREKNNRASLRVLLDAEKRGISDVWMKSFIKKMEEENEKNS